MRDMGSATKAIISGGFLMLDGHFWPSLQNETSNPGLAEICQKTTPNAKRQSEIIDKD